MTAAGDELARAHRKVLKRAAGASANKAGSFFDRQKCGTMGR